MSIEDRIARMEKNLDGLAVVQDQMMDLLGFTAEGERRLATRQQRTEENVVVLSGKLVEVTVKLDVLSEKVVEVTEKLDGLIGVVDGIVRRG